MKHGDGGMRNGVLRFALLIIPVVVGGAACRTARAAEPIERPALEVPPPPPRVIVPLPGPNAQPRLEPVEELPALPDKSPTRPRPQREKPTDPNKPDPKTEQVEAATPPPAPVAPPVRLENPNSAQLATQVRDTLSRARSIFEGIDRNSLTTEPRRRAYDDARLFIQQADEAVQKSNFVAAKEYADKAERLVSSIK